MSKSTVRTATRPPKRLVTAWAARSRSVPGVPAPEAGMGVVGVSTVTPRSGWWTGRVP